MTAGVVIEGAISPARRKRDVGAAVANGDRM